jgi:hypothetical protein
MRYLREHAGMLEHLDPHTENASCLVACFAQWVDIGVGNPSQLREMLARFKHEIRANLLLREYVHLRMAKGMLAMNDEGTAEALAHFDAILALACGLRDKETLAVVHFWKARCLRKAGEYE